MVDENQLITECFTGEKYWLLIANDNFNDQSVHETSHCTFAEDQALRWIFQYVMQLYAWPVNPSA